jgi:hypothetical protein
MTRRYWRVGYEQIYGTNKTYQNSPFLSSGFVFALSACGVHGIVLERIKKKGKEVNSHETISLSLLTFLPLNRISFHGNTWPVPESLQDSEQ